MERVISDEEKIKRAIEISQRRNKFNKQVESARLNVSVRKNYRLLKKMILQIIICALIYIIFYLIVTTNYSFSNNIISKTNEILNYDININNIYYNCIEYFKSFNTQEVEEKDANIQENIIQNNINNLDTTKEINVISDIDTAEEVNAISNINISTEENSHKEDEEDTNNVKEKTQMEKDAEEVKTICEMQKPLSGKITSEFGEREVTSTVMSADHKGIDIAANAGTEIKAAMNGTVIVAEENSEYGKFIKIKKEDVMTVYAHCKSLKVKKGDEVKIGQTIATVGSTGNSTGPHLHFEIRLLDRFIDPRYVIEF